MRVARVRCELVIQAELMSVFSSNFGQVVDEIVNDKALIEGSENRRVANRRDVVDDGNTRNAAHEDAWDEIGCVRIRIQQRSIDARDFARRLVIGWRDRDPTTAGAKRELVDQSWIEAVSQRKRQRLSRTILPICDR